MASKPFIAIDSNMDLEDVLSGPVKAEARLLDFVYFATGQIDEITLQFPAHEGMASVKLTRMTEIAA